MAFEHKGPEAKERPPAVKYVPLGVYEGMTIQDLRNELKKYPGSGIVSGKFEEVGAEIRFAVKVKNA